MATKTPAAPVRAVAAPPRKAPAAIAAPAPAPAARTRVAPAKAPMAKAPAAHTESKTGLIKTPQSLIIDKDFLALQKQIDALENSIGFTTTGLVQSGYVKNAIHTGVLMYDFVVGGGGAPGRLTILPGLEGSGKSTIVDNLAAVCVSQGIPVYWFDAESALDPSYVGRIFARYNLEIADMMGRRDANGRWVVPPVIRYTNTHVGEHVFKMIKGLCDALPSLRQDHAGVWYRKVEVKGRPDRWEEDPRQGKPPFLFIIDSWPALVPEMRDENIDSAPMASQARMISAYINTIKGPIARVNAVAFSVNQIRTKPGVTHGNPEYEPCGMALGFFSDVRTQIRRVSPSTLKVGTGSYTEEPSYDGHGVDRYVYARLKNTKNKSFIPMREGTIRIRYEHRNGPGDGICRTWDVSQFLIATGQAVHVNGQRLRMHLRPTTRTGKQNLFEEGKIISRVQMKNLIENPANRSVLYNHCLHQIQSGFAFEVEKEAIHVILEGASAKTAAAVETDAEVYDDDSGVAA